MKKTYLRLTCWNSDFRILFNRQKVRGPQMRRKEIYMSMLALCCSNQLDGSTQSKMIPPTFYILYLSWRRWKVRYADASAQQQFPNTREAFLKETLKWNKVLKMHHLHFCRPDKEISKMSQSQQRSQWGIVYIRNNYQIDECLVSMRHQSFWDDWGHMFTVFR